MEPWEELLISSTGDDKPMTSPLHIFFLNEKLCHHVTTSFNAGKWLSHKEGGIGHLLVFSAMGDLGGHRARILLSICTRYSRPVLSDLPTYLFIHFLQPALEKTPFCWRPRCLGDVVKTRHVGGRDRIFITFFKMPSVRNRIRL